MRVAGGLEKRIISGAFIENFDDGRAAVVQRAMKGEPGAAVGAQGWQGHVGQ
jgi:hypothetical protein